MLRHKLRYEGASIQRLQLKIVVYLIRGRSCKSLYIFFLSETKKNVLIEEKILRVYIYALYSFLEE